MVLVAYTLLSLLVIRLLLRYTHIAGSIFRLVI